MKSLENEVLASGRVERSREVGWPIPQVLAHRGSVFSYAFQEGVNLSDILNDSECWKFLSWMNTRFWAPRMTDAPRFRAVCEAFYFDKTKLRLSLLEKLPGFETIDEPIAINGRECPSVRELMSCARDYVLSGGMPSTFHGDLHADNVIKAGDQYTLIDWRHSFGDLRDIGDRYYDLAKFLHTLEFSVRCMNEGSFRVTTKRDELILNHKVTFAELGARDAFFRFVDRHHYDSKRIRIINGLIFINMAPLYSPELARYLYYLGRYTLQLSLSEV